jgi:hypothetical protein
MIGRVSVRGERHIAMNRQGDVQGGYCEVSEFVHDLRHKQREKQREGMGEWDSDSWDLHEIQSGRMTCEMVSIRRILREYRNQAHTSGCRTDPRPFELYSLSSRVPSAAPRE